VPISREVAFAAAILGALILARGLWVSTPPKHRCTDALSLVRWYSKVGMIIGGAGLIFGSLRVILGF